MTLIKKVKTLPVTIFMALVFISCICIAAIFAPSLAPFDPWEQDLLGVAQNASSMNWLGKDELGRDIFSRLIAGSRSAVIGPLLIASSGLFISVFLGVLAGYRGGIIDNFIMRCVDFIVALPSLLIAIVVISVTEGCYWMAILVLSILNVQGNIRIIRGVTLEQRNLPYIEALRVVGVGRLSVMYKHIVPNLYPILIANFATDFAGALVALSGLSFLGLGSQPGTPDWGRMLADGQSLLFTNYWAAVGPGLAIVLLAISVNLIGDWVYDFYVRKSLQR